MKNSCHIFFFIGMVFCLGCNQTIGRLDQNFFLQIDQTSSESLIGNRYTICNYDFKIEESHFVSIDTSYMRVVFRRKLNETELETIANLVEKNNWTSLDETYCASHIGLKVQWQLQLLHNKKYKKIFIGDIKLKPVIPVFKAIDGLIPNEKYKISKNCYGLFEIG